MFVSLSELTGTQPEVVHSGGKKKIRLQALGAIKKTLRTAALHSVCEEARCPNRGECFTAGTATFLAMGDVCTRTCRFCQIESGRPAALQADEPDRLAEAAAAMGLRHVVVTSVNRDDLRDGGADHLRQILVTIRSRVPSATCEILTPDFQGNGDAVATVCSAGPDVFNHNLETVPSLYRRVRPGARLQRSLGVLQRARRELPGALIKSGLMLGLGETDAELSEVFAALTEVGTDILTLGQYFQPSRNHLPVQEMVAEERYAKLEQLAHKAGISHVYAGRFVRSSYNAGPLLDRIRSERI